MRFTKFVLSIIIQGDIPYETLEYWHMIFRLLAHPVLAAVSGNLLAVWIEVGKWIILGRHFDKGEMWLNVAGVVGGILVYLVVAKVFRVLCRKK